MKAVKICNTRPEAEMYASILTDQGIECLVQADDCGGVRPFMTIPDGVRILVGNDDYLEAVRILEAMREDRQPGQE